MCRSIKTLRPPQLEAVTPADVEAAALQFVRKVSGFHRPAPHNAVVFDRAVAEVAAATQRLLDELVVRGAQPPAGRARTAERRVAATEPLKRAAGAGR